MNPSLIRIRGYGKIPTVDDTDCGDVFGRPIEGWPQQLQRTSSSLVKGGGDLFDPAWSLGSSIAKFPLISTFLVISQMLNYTRSRRLSILKNRGSDRSDRKGYGSTSSNLKTLVPRRYDPLSSLWSIDGSCCPTLLTQKFPLTLLAKFHCSRAISLCVLVHSDVGGNPICRIRQLNTKCLRFLAPVFNLVTIVNQTVYI